MKLFCLIKIKFTTSESCDNYKDRPWWTATLAGSRQGDSRRYKLTDYNQNFDWLVQLRINDSQHTLAVTTGFTNYTLGDSSSESLYSPSSGPTKISSLSELTDSTSASTNMKTMLG